MRRLIVTALCIPAALGAQADGLSAGAELAYGHRVAVPSARAIRRTGGVVIDGKLDEAAWRTAAPITDFTQFDPSEGKPPSQKTDVRFLFDDVALYVGAKMYDTEGAPGVTTRLVRRDANFDSDMFQLVIDAYHDHLSRAFFSVNPAGAKNDLIGIGNSCCDASWDPIWEASTRIDSDGWTAEIRIPFSQLRFSRDSVQTWGLQVRRYIKRLNEEDDWSFWRKNEAGGPPRFGHLEGLRIPAATSRLELLPYVVSKSEPVRSATGDPFNTGGRPSFRAGLDLKNRLTSNLTLDATINPDFGQVEVDPAVLNLSAFETFFPEKRPFFVEGAQVFNFGNFNCNFCANGEDMSGFYSRRVGRAPTGASLASANYAYADVPDATTILGAAKITGRTASGYTVGLLTALTGQADARVQSSSGARGTQEVEPLADYVTARLKRDYMNGNLVVGGILSGVARRIDSTFAPRLARHAELYGNDVVYTWGEHMYSFRGNVAVTNVSGDARQILARQTSSARYFQRPDRGAGWGGTLSNRLDSTATSLRGAGAYARIAKESGDWFGELGLNTRTPGYETNDFAFQQRADYIWTNANIGRFWSKPTRWYRTLTLLGGGETQRNFEGDVTAASVHGYVSAQTPQFWNVSTFFIDFPASMDDRLLRGGPVVKSAHSHFAQATVNSDSRGAVVWSANAGYNWDDRGGTSPRVSVGVDYRPRSNMTISFAPSWSPSVVVPQYVTSVADSTATSFFGSRYVMSELEQRTLGLDTRLNITFSPTMTLELYAQPFFAAGRYRAFEEFVAPRRAELSVYGRDRGTIAGVRDTTGMVARYSIDPDGAGPAHAFLIDNPDFTQQSLRGNAVFRWEYRPGSVIYVAWTQSRFGEQAFGDLDFARDRTALLSARPENVFLVKASWWMPK